MQKKKPAQLTHLSPPPPRFLCSQISEISMANSRQNIRKLVKDGFVIRKPQKVRAHPLPPPGVSSVSFLSRKGKLRFFSASRGGF